MYLQKSNNRCYENEQLMFYENDCEGNRTFLAEPRLLETYRCKKIWL